MYNVGIDVGNKELVMVIRHKGKNQKARTFSNTSDGHAKIVKTLSVKKGGAKICLEATGVYHFDLAVALNHAGLNLMVVNPKAAKHYFEALMTRSKTDQVDAGILAQYAETMPFEAWVMPDEKIIRLQAFSRKIAALTRLKAQTKNQLHALESNRAIPEIIQEETRESITFFEMQIQRLKEHALALIASDEELQRPFEIVTSVKGIADASAIQLLGELLVLPKDMRNRQWVAFAGLDPRHHKSGTSVSKKPRISKAGNSYLRRALYMPALCAANRDPYVKAYYRHLIDNQGLKKMQALCAVMRKLLHAIHAMLKNNVCFDNTRFFNMAEVEIL
ncbi:IS110 family transposase [uncultured Desulfuromonas sp.]|uniref:IS110 family transposase n=1 Tax=uncultured Desulfuromonas sp. TaxID=181013 RepID=UPI002AAB8661|nr:IS110 family transposase [uncultured Desulfuromonas sp.]